MTTAIIAHGEITRTAENESICLECGGVMMRDPLARSTVYEIFDCRKCAAWSIRPIEPQQPQPLETDTQRPPKKRKGRTKR